MPTRIVCVDPDSHAYNPRVIADTGQAVPFGEEVEIDDPDLAESLLEQTDVWARPTTTAAKKAEKEVGK